MKQLNTMPIELFLEKARISLKSNQKNLILTSNEVESLAESISLVMTRLAGALDAQLHTTTESPPVLSISMDGGGFGKL